MNQRNFKASQNNEPWTVQPKGMSGAHKPTCSKMTPSYEWGYMNTIEISAWLCEIQVNQQPSGLFYTTKS